MQNMECLQQELESSDDNAMRLSLSILRTFEKAREI